MRTKFYFLMLLFAASIGQVWGADPSYTITFGNNANGAAGLTTSTKASTVISNGTDYVTASPFTVNSGNIYYGDTKTCIRLGKSGNASSLTIALSSTGQVNATKITVNCDNTGGKSNTSATLSVNGSTVQTTTTSAADYDFTLAGSKLESITLAASASVRVYSITVTYSSAGGSKYTVHYDVQGHGTAPTDQTNISAGGKATEPTAPTCTGYTFGGWFENSECSGSQWNFSTGTISANKTLYAKWTAKTYTITLDANGHGAANGSATATYDATTLSNVSGVTANTGYALNGYFTATSGGTKVINADGTLVSNVSGYTDATGKWNKDAACTLYAQYTQQFTITFIDKLQNTTGYTGPTGHTLQVADGATFTFPDALTDGNPTAEQKASGTCEQQHYHFVGWILSTEESTANNDGHANVKEAGSMSGAVSAAATYYAVWAKEE